MKYRKRPVIIEAIQYTNANIQHPALFIVAPPSSYNVYIDTLEGRMTVNIGDWIITGINGESYPCKPDIFEKTYEKVEEEVDE